MQNLTSQPTVLVTRRQEEIIAQALTFSLTLLATVNRYRPVFINTDCLSRLDGVREFLDQQVNGKAVVNLLQFGSIDDVGLVASLR